MDRFTGMQISSHDSPVSCVLDFCIEAPSRKSYINPSSLFLL
jgi:hypothetical protein